jgi:TatD DNase family protein
MMIKKEFDIPLTESELPLATTITQEANAENVSIIINVGTRRVENENCILLAQKFPNIFATVGIHPNDSDEWQNDLKAMKSAVAKAKAEKHINKIVGIGECGMDRHYPDHNLNRQRDAFKAQIELALENDLALVIHSRDAYDETLTILEEYKNNINRAVMHCFSYDQTFAEIATSWNFMLGIGGTSTYPKNNELRDIVEHVNIKHIVLETDAPFLPVQTMRGKQNHPKYIKNIAEYIAQLRGESFEYIAAETTKNAFKLFKLEKHNEQNKYF